MDNGVLPFWTANGFQSNPFESTNAADEERLAHYFLPPPYFRSVLGDPRQPRPSAVFAPRGGGKTAQRRMVEERVSGGVLAITHNEFDLDAWGGIQGTALVTHLSRINELTLVGLVSILATRTSQWTNLEPGDKEAFRSLLAAYLSEIDAIRLESIIRGLANLRERQVRFLRGLATHTGTLASYAWSTLTGTAWPGPLELPPQEHDRYEEDVLNDFRTIGHLVRQIRLDAVYVLVDGVDETPATQNDVRSAYQLIARLLENLGVVETAPYAIKFFLPTSLRDIWIDRGGRADRVTPYETTWTDQLLIEMAQRRLQAFLVEGATYDIERIMGTGAWPGRVLLFAEHSPRNLIRILHRFVDDATNAAASLDEIEINDEIREVSTDGFTFDRGLEIATRQNLDRLRRLRSVDFTIGDVTQRLQVSGDTARRYVRGWQARGFVEATPERTKPGVAGRPEVTYTLTSYCVARQAFPELSLDQFLDTKIRRCPGGHSNLRDWDLWESGYKHTCLDCGAQITV